MTTTTAPQIDPVTLDAFRHGIPAGPNHDTKVGDRGSLTSYVPTTDPTVFVTIHTTHHGRAEYIGPIEYAITSTVGAERRGGNFRLSAPMSAKRLTTVHDVKRRTAKAMRDAHAAACAELAAILATEPAALASVLADVPAAR